MFNNFNLKQSCSAWVLLIIFASSFSTAAAKKGRKGKPPEEAFTACANQTEAGTYCSFENPAGKSTKGTCKTAKRDQSRMVCKPSRASKRDKSR